MDVSLDLVFNQLPGVYICWKDEYSRFLGCNNAFAALLGKSKHEIIGSIDTIEKHVLDDKEVRDTGKAMMDMIETIPDKTGQQIQIKTNKAALLNKEGEICGTVVVFTRYFS
ncbi:MAG: hypothetical protein S4CHLAM7_05870 [Chlamydiae bacterium]|nr:hypothetical protein [Chlamydiota bacterium]